MRNVRYLLLGACLLLLVTSALSAGSASAKSAATIPASSWLHAYIGYSAQFGYTLHAQQSPPVLWLYNPSGKPVKFLMQSDAPKLKTLMNNFPQSVKTASALEHEPSLDAMRKILAKAIGKPIAAEKTTSRWTAIVLLAVLPGGKCVHCQEFLKPLKHAVHHSKGKLKLVTVRLTQQ
jgi:hypothetical protein